MKNSFVYILALSASILVISAAYFSVTGFGKLFSGAFIPIVILISGLEFAKLVVTSFLYRYWNKISIAFKSYLMVVVAALMVITSAGLYGFLSSAYSTTSDKLSQIDGSIAIYEQKKAIMYESVDRIKTNIQNKNKRIESLTSLRTNQESRIDTLYKKGMISSARKTEILIKEANNEIALINHVNDSLNKSIQHVLDSTGRIDMKILELKSSNIKGDIGPLKYVASLTNRSIDSIVNFFILLLVFISDPLAVCLVIATNKVMMERKEVEEAQDYWVKFAKIKKVDKQFFSIADVLKNGNTSELVSKHLNLVRKTSNGKSYVTHSEFMADGGLIDGSNVQLLKD